MTTVLDESTPTARKSHQCDVCLGRIAVGDTYLRQKCVDNGELWTYKAHRLCDACYWEEWDDDGWLRDGDMLDFDDSVRPRLLSAIAAMFGIAAPPGATP